ncbi:MAG: hypothetical protein IBJ18_10515 [Phycisphaerales bacterium]|nr:hypothetical protein [Phycisphaerales bacterium]
MVTDYLITFQVKPSAMREFLFHLGFFQERLACLGYLVSRYCARWRSPENPNVVNCRWMMTGRGAFKHAWEKETRLDDDPSLRDEVRSTLSAPPTIKALLTSETVRSCKCAKNSQKPLYLWWTGDEGPPLFCCKGGVIPMYTLPLSELVCFRLHEWSEHAGNLDRLWTRTSNRSKQLKQFYADYIVNPDSSFAAQSRELAKLIESETGRKVNAYLPPFHIFGYPYDPDRADA